MTEKKYYYLDDIRNVQGPHTIDELRSLNAEGKLDASTSICEEGSSVWVSFEVFKSKLGVSTINVSENRERSAEVPRSKGDRIKNSCFVISTLCLLVISIHSVRIERMLASVPRLKDVYSDRGYERPASMPESRWNVPFVIVQDVEGTVDVDVKGTVDVDGDVEVTNFSSIPVEIQNSRVPVEVEGGVVTIDNRSFEPVPVTVR